MCCFLSHLGQRDPDRLQKLLEPFLFWWPWESSLLCYAFYVSWFYIFLFLPLKTWKNHPQKLLIIKPPLFLILPTGQNQPKSHFILHNNVSLRDFNKKWLIEFGLGPINFQNKSPFNSDISRCAKTVTNSILPFSFQIGLTISSQLQWCDA